MPGSAQTPLLSRPGPSFGHAAMLIGHVNLAASTAESDQRFITLVEALQQLGMRQHVVVRNSVLAKRLSVLGDVEVGPVVNSPVLAYCLMPGIDVAHVHEPAAGQVGLLLALTRSTPYVLTHRLILSSQSRLRGRPSREILAEVLRRVPVPVEA